jgi:hypothetical protein
VHDERSRIEYAALLHQARDAERMMVFSWLAPGVMATTLLAWGIGNQSPGFMVSVVLTAAAGFLAMTHWRERAALIAGYLEIYHENESDNPSYFNRLGRLKATLGHSSGREWHVTTYFNAISAVATVFAWISSSSGNRGEMWAPRRRGLRTPIPRRNGVARTPACVRSSGGSAATSSRHLWGLQCDE